MPKVLAALVFTDSLLQRVGAAAGKERDENASVAGGWRNVWYMLLVVPETSENGRHDTATDSENCKRQTYFHHLELAGISQIAAGRVIVEYLLSYVDVSAEDQSFLDVLQHLSADDVKRCQLHTWQHINIVVWFDLSTIMMMKTEKLSVYNT